MTDTPAFKPKKSVALSGVTAGNTALCTVGRTGNDLHYRGYDILEIAAVSEFEQIAYLLVHEKLPNRAQLEAYKSKLRALRGLPATVRSALEVLPASSHPMDVLRTGVSVLGCTLPEKDDHDAAGARELADRMVASFGSMLCYWYHFSHSGMRIQVETEDDSVGGHFLHLLHRRPPPASWVRAMHTSLILYAEHEFNASTFAARVIAGTGADLYSCITGAIGALRGPKHGGANETALVIQQRYDNPDQAGDDIRTRVANKEVIIGFGVHHRRPAQPGDQGGGAGAVAGGRRHEALRHRRAHRGGDAGSQEDVPQPRLVLGGRLPHDGHPHRDVHAAVRHRAHHRLVGARHRAAR